MAKIRFLVKPGAKENAIGKNQDGSLWIRVAAPAHEGKANLEIQRHLSEKLRISKSSVRISSGKSSRFKIIEIDADEAILMQQLQILIG
jgi:uncharacterized protein (TIGR00251 family)